MAQPIQKLVAVGGVGGGVGPFDQLVAELSGNGTEAIVLVGEVSGPESNGDATPRRRATGLRRLRGGSADRAGGAATDRRRTRAADKAPVADEDSAYLGRSGVASSETLTCFRWTLHPRTSKGGDQASTAETTCSL